MIAVDAGVDLGGRCRPVCGSGRPMPEMILAFGLQDRLQPARSSLSATNRSGANRCPPKCRGPPAASETAGSDRAGLASRSAGRERFRSVRADDPGHVVTGGDAHFCVRASSPVENVGNSNGVHRGRHAAISGGDGTVLSGSDRSRAGSLCTGRGGSCRWCRR